MRIVFVYFSVNDEIRNNKMKKKIEAIMGGISDSLIVTGDFHGQIGFKQEQKLEKEIRNIFGMVRKN